MLIFVAQQSDARRRDVDVASLAALRCSADADADLDLDLSASIVLTRPGCVACLLLWLGHVSACRRCQPRTRSTFHVHVAVSRSTFTFYVLRSAYHVRLYVLRLSARIYRRVLDVSCVFVSVSISTKNSKHFCSFSVRNRTCFAVFFQVSQVLQSKR